VAASRSVRNSLVGRLNRAAPQSKQTEIVGKTRTPGLSRLSEPEKWIIISVGNSASFSDEHTGHTMRALLKSASEPGNQANHLATPLYDCTSHIAGNGCTLEGPHEDRRRWVGAKSWGCLLRSG
jgi:hypothetical protein